MQQLCAMLRGARRDLRVEAGVTLAPLHLRGKGYTPDLAATRLEVGLRGAFVGRRWLHDRLALWAGLEATGTPRPHELAVAGREIRGHTPVLWLRVAAGVAVRLY